MPSSIMNAFSLLLAGCLTGCQPAPEQATSPVATPEGVQLIPFASKAFDVLVDDIDGDGRNDLAFTAHGDSVTQIFYQRSSRQFDAGPILKVGGFHPNDLVRLPDPEHRRYLINAEAENALILLEPTADGRLKPYARYPVPSPRATTILKSRRWGDILAVTPYAGTRITLLRGFNTVTAAAEERKEAILRPTFGTMGPPIAADLHGDGNDQLIVTNLITGEVWALAPAAPNKEPRIKRLIRFTHGAVRFARAFDINGDRALDLLLPNQLAPLQINLLVNNGKGKMKPAEPVPVPFVQSMHNFDAARDSDGVLTILSGGHRGPFVLLRWPPDSDVKSLPALALTMPENMSFGLTKLADIDADGWLDVVLANNRQGAMVLYGPLWERFQSLTNSPDFLHLGDPANEKSLKPKTHQ